MTVFASPALAAQTTGSEVAFVGTATLPDQAANLLWTWKLNGALQGLFGVGPRVVFTTPSSVVSTDANGNASFDDLEVIATYQPTGNSATCQVRLVQGPPFINHTNPMTGVTEGQPTPSGSTPQDRQHPQGPRTTSVPPGWSLLDEGNEGSGSVVGSCVQLQTPLLDPEIAKELAVVPPEQGGCCLSYSTFNPDWSYGGEDKGGGGGQTPVNSVGGGNNGSVASSAPMFCASEWTASASQAWTRPYGTLQFKTGCGALVTRGKAIELCQWFANVPDGLISSERILGKKTAFGWQARLIQDTVGNVAIYWGSRTVEAWKSPDGGATFTAPPGVFGTLTKQGDGSFTRTKKDSTYYDFDSNGRIQKIKDRSADGNVVYFNYNGSNQMVRITGPGLGYKPYFTYDGSGLVNAMTLESSDASKERVVYYDYDASSRLNKVIWPENCITYFDYDGNDNLTLETNPDNYRTYFVYGSETIPRLQEINMPLDAAVYFSYDNTVPRHVRTIADGPQKQIDYQWAGLPEILIVAGEVNYFTYDASAKPTSIKGNDGATYYYEWDATAQQTAMRGPLDSLQYFTYGAHGRMTSWKNEEGRTTYWNYDANGFQTNWIDRKGAVTYFERDTYGKITSKKDRVGNVTYFTYNSQGLVTSKKDADLTVRYFDWNPGAEVELVIDELANVAYYHHDKRGRITRYKDFASQIRDYGFDNRSNMTVMIDARGNAWYFEYDGLSRRTVSRTPLLNTSYFEYSRTTVLTSQVDPRGNPTYFYYTTELRLSARENALQERTYFTYTLAGQQESVKDARGNAQYWTYDIFHRRTSMKDGVGNVTYYQYDPDGDNSATTDPRGNTTYIYYDEMDRLFARRNALNEVSYFYFDAEGNQTCSEDALQRRTYFYYDSLNRRHCAEDAQKNRTYFTFEQRGPVSSQKNARGYVSYLYYDKLERQFSTRDALNNVTYVEYDANSNRVAVRDARGITSYFNFDNENRNVSTTTPLNETTYLAYDAGANRSSVKDARGNLSYFYFDALNRNFCSEDAKQARNYFTFDAAGNTDSEKDPLARVTYHYYDANNRRYVTQDALAGLRYFTFDAASNNASVKNPRGFVTYLYYDALNRMFCQQSPVAGFTYYTFDTAGNRTAVKDPVARLNYFYFDTLNRQYAAEDGLQKRTYFEFDTVGNTVSIKNPRRATVTPAEVGIQYFTHDALNRRNSAKDEVAKVWYYDYDAASNLKVQTNPRAALTYWEYDALNRKQSQKDPLARTWYWTYDAVGNVNSVKDGKAQVTYYQYDTVNLLSRVDYPSPFLSDYFEYDNARQRTAMADKTGGTYWLYDSLGRATFRKNPWFGSLGAAVSAQRLYYEYDAAGNRISLKDQDGFLVYYDWDGANRMREVRSSTYGGAITYYEFNVADQIVHERRQNGTITYYGYDSAARITRIHHRTAAAAKLEYLDYTRDEAGNPTQIVIDTGAIMTIATYFNYDGANRIAREAWRSSSGSNIYGFDYSYDGAGNRIAKKHTAPSTVAQYWEYDLGDQLTLQKHGASTNVYFAFDSNGNLAVEHDTNASAGRTYYDYESRNLLSRVDFSGSTSTNYFYYNAIGERVRKDESLVSRLYTWDGIDVLQERSHDSGALRYRYVKGYTAISGIGAYAMWDPRPSSSIPTFFHKNQVGSTILQTNSAGSVVGTLRYDAWGQPFEASGTAVSPMRFNGKEIDPDFVAFNSNNRRYHYPARTYVPFRAAFLQVDPLLMRRWLGVRARLQLQAYAQVMARVTVLVDPSGMAGISEDNCNLLIDEIRSEQAWRIEMMKKAGCGEPKWVCTCCYGGDQADTTEKWFGSDYAPNTSRITLCYNLIGVHERREVARHEFIHAFDICGHPEYGDCIHMACMEIRAYSASGQCKTIRHNATEHEKCVRDGATESMEKQTEGILGLGFFAKCTDAAGWVGKAWKDCYVPEGAALGLMPHNIGN